MSTEQSLDPHLIEQTKQQIRALVAEIAQLAKEDISPEEFYGGFLTRVVSALAAEGGAVWTTNDEGRLALQYQIEIQKTGLRENEEANAQHSRLLYKVLADGEAVVLPPHSGAGDDGAGNPTEFLLLLGLIKTDLETGGIVEVFQRTDSGGSAQKGYLRFLLQMCELAGDYLKSHQLRHFSDRQSLWTQLEDFTRVVHASLDPRETAFTISNEGRRLIECDRLSVAIRKGNKCVVEAISGQDVFDKRSNLVRLLNKLASAVVATGDPIWYTGDTRDMAPQVEDAVQDYVDEAHSKTVAVLPLKRPEPPEEDDPKKRPALQPCIGALIVEQIEDSRVPASMLPRVDVVCRHSSTALANSLEHQSLFLMPVWRAIGHSRWIVQARTLPKTLSITAAIVAVIVFLCVFPANLDMESKGTLEPVVFRNIYAPIDGDVQELKVDHNQTVAKGQVLLKMHSTNEEVELLKTQGDLLSADKERDAKIRAINEAQTSRTDDLHRLQGEKAGLDERIKSLKSQLKVLEARNAELEVSSPITGVVVTWDPKTRLLTRPVQRGSSLMRIADLNKEWLVQLHMPEQNMGFVEEAQHEYYRKQREELQRLLLEQKRAAAPSAETAPVAPAEAPAAADAPLTSKDETGPIFSGESTTATGAVAEKPADASAAPPAAPADPLAAEVDAQLAAIPDEQLYDRWSQFAKAKLDAQLNEIRKSLPDGEAKTQLDDVLRQPDYDQAWESLSGLKANLADQELATALSAIPKDRFIDMDENVTFILATDPGRNFQGRIKEIHRSAEVRGDEGNTVLIKVAIDKSQFQDLRSGVITPGAAVTAKVHCGRSSLGFKWFHQVWSFVQTKIIFRYF
jgi:multidrug efflux pump subunit AcrA (membrane-fusion protein)